MSCNLVRSLASAARIQQNNLRKQILVRSVSSLTQLTSFPAATKPLLSQGQTCFTPAYSFSSEVPSINEKIEGLVKQAKVVVFMKGVPAAPQCGFSNAVVQIMRMHDVTFESHNVLVDEELRQGIKDFSNWPTIPQVYMEGEFIGGCDIVLQMHQSGELIEELGKVGIKSALLTEDEEKK
eukprot:GFUD01014965.1.p1 GENE.GFUD01014965.1~~GFUD01014965.1.p1  ORF type:complete len:180 (+),score=47.42 GFUD01014965.1:59-598(+)